MCQVCEHPSRAAIEAELLAPDAPAWARLRDQHGLHHLALIAHKRQHMKPAACAEINMPEVLSSANSDLARNSYTHDPAACTKINMLRVKASTGNPCVVCTHRCKEAIYAELLAGALPSVVAHHFQLDRRILDLHIAHEPVLSQAAARRMFQTFDNRLMTIEPCEDDASRVEDYPGKITKTWREFQPRVIGLPSDDPIRVVKHHVGQAARAWRQVDEERRTQERLQMILEEAFRDPNMGL